MHNRTMKRALGAIALACGLGGLALTTLPVDAGSSPTARAEVALYDTALAKQGVMELVERNGQVRITVQVRNATTGFHGFHVHATGLCRNPDGTANFALAGGHYGHDPVNGVTHGRHPGDLPSILVDASGNGTATVSTDRFAIADVVGRAVIFHGGPDNFANIPVRYGIADDTTLSTGDSGARVLCGVINAR